MKYFLNISLYFQAFKHKLTVQVFFIYSFYSISIAKSHCFYNYLNNLFGMSRLLITHSDCLNLRIFKLKLIEFHHFAFYIPY